MANRTNENSEENRKREFRRQQERLKMMGPDSERKIVSADAMINSLLEKSDTFRKVKTDLPVWLQVDSTTSSPYYDQIWELVKATDKAADTAKISQLLLTSGLHPDVLGFIWNLANTGTPGQLIKQELYIVLALVGLAQTGCTFNNISVLNLVPSPPFPRLIVPFQPVLGRSPSLSGSLMNTTIASGPPGPQVVPFTPLISTQFYSSHAPLPASYHPIISSPPSSLDKKDLPSLSIDDDFDDFQSVPAPSNVCSLPSMLPEPQNTYAHLITQETFGMSDLVLTPKKTPLEPPPITTATPSLPIWQSHSPQSQTSEMLSNSSSATGPNFSQQPPVSSTPTIPWHLPSDQCQVIQGNHLGSIFTQKPGQVLQSPTASCLPDRPTDQSAHPVSSRATEDQAVPSAKLQSITHHDQSLSFTSLGAQQNSSESAPSKFTDDFSDFQSADPYDTNIVQPAPRALPKLSSFIKVSPESERRLQHITPPECLTALPESKISSRNRVSAMPSIAVVGASRNIGSRLANHSLAGGKPDKTRQLHKHIKVKPVVSINSPPPLPKEIFPKCHSTFLLKETKIPSMELESESETIDHERTRQIEIPNVGSFKETTLPVGVKTEASITESITLTCNPEKPKLGIFAGETTFNSNQSNSMTKLTGDELLGMEEDKYGALRDLEIINTLQNEVPEKQEDFGDFLSAELTSEKDVEAWSSWNSGVNVPLTPVESFSMKLEESAGLSRKAEEDLFDSSRLEANVEDKAFLNQYSDFNSFPELATLPESNSALFDGLITDFSFKETHSSMESAPEPKAQPNYDIHDFEEDFGDFVTPNFEAVKTAEDSQSLNSYEFGMRSHGSWQSLNQQGGRDSGSESRKGSVPSLNLQIEESGSVAARCLNCCLNLLKEAVTIFNGVSDRTVLAEIFQTSQAKNYVRYLSVVYSIASRVAQHGSGSSSLFDEITCQWERIRSIASDYSISVGETQVDMPAGGGEVCPVCRGPTSEADVQQSSTSTGVNSSARFHPSCANLWLNCIDTSLPCF